jgi:hypothetical protein
MMRSSAPSGITNRSKVADEATRPLTQQSIQLSDFNPSNTSFNPNNNNQSAASRQHILSSSSVPVIHSWYLYAWIPCILKVIYGFIASLTLDLSDNSSCDQRVSIYLFLSIGASYSFFIFLCYLLLGGRPKTRKLQNTVLLTYSLLTIALTIWGSVQMYDTAAVNLFDPTTPNQKFSYSESSCTRSLHFRISLLGLAIYYFFFFGFFSALLYELCIHCCQAVENEFDLGDEDAGYTSNFLILGIGGVRRRRAELEAEIRFQKALGLGLAKQMKLTEQEEEEEGNDYRENDDTVRPIATENHSNQNQNQNQYSNENERLFSAVSPHANATFNYEEKYQS